MTKKIIKNIGILVGIFIMLEIVARLIIPYASYDDDTNSHRNPFYKRGWPEYIEHTLSKSTDKKRIIIISNSQGFGRETNSKNIYSNELQNLLSTHDYTEYEVLNWTVDGPIPSDLVMLFAKALAANPAIIVFNTFPNNFDSRGNKDINFSSHDLDLLISDREISNLLNLEWKEKFVDKGFQIYSSFVTKSYLLRLRFYVDDKFNDKNKKEIFTFLPAGGFNAKIVSKKKHRTINISRHRNDHVKQIFDTYELSNNTNTKVFINQMPLNKNLFKNKNKSKRNLQLFNRSLNSYAKNKEMVSTKNYSNELNNKYFYTATHFNFYNHRVFAKKMFDDLVPYLK